MWIAGIFFERETFGTEHINIGRVWHDGNTGFVRLTGFRYGQFAAKPYDNVEPVFIRGDIVAYGPVQDDMQRIEQWCGFIYTETKQDESIYIGRLEVDPWPLLFQRKRAETDLDGTYRYGTILSIKETS